MAEVVLKLGLPPLEGFLYFVERDCTVWKHQGSAKECVSDKTFERDEGYLYFIDLDGDLASLSTDLGDLWGAQSGSGGLGHRHSLMDGRRREHR